jgi:antiviral defense system Shedu protein SduA
MDDPEADYHFNKRLDKLYVSSRIAGNYRIASKIISDNDHYSHAVEHGDVVLRVTHGGRQEIVAKFVEVSREIYVLTFQRWNVVKGVPFEKIHFSFRHSEIDKLRDFLNNIEQLHFKDDGKVNVREQNLRLVEITDEHARRILQENPQLIAQIARNEITEQDIVALGYRRKQLVYFEKLLFAQGFFEAEKALLGCKPEDVWQKFFEANHWIFGYGLSYIFLDSLDDAKLEQTVRGYSVASYGKRVDALMKTRGLIQSLCFVEIKRHDTDLLAPRSYRPGVWRASDDLAGGIAQLQETIRGAAESIHERFIREDEDGSPTGEELFNIEPRSFMVIGCLSEFQDGSSTNIQKYRAFEMFRRNTIMPEIITFDELYFRAKYIVEQQAA